MIHDEHKAFARAVVALAREHGMDNIAMEFRFGFDKAYADRLRLGNDPVKLQWHSGRHGDTSKISLESRSFEGIDEAAAQAPREPS